MGWVLDGECGTPNLPGDVVFLPLLMATGPPGTGGGWGGSGDPRVSSAAVTLGDNSVTGCHVIKIEKKMLLFPNPDNPKGEKNPPARLSCCSDSPDFQSISSSSRPTRS